MVMGTVMVMVVVTVRVTVMVMATVCDGYGYGYGYDYGSCSRLWLRLLFTVMLRKITKNGNINVYVSRNFQISAQDKEAHPSMRQGAKRRRDHDHNHNREL